MLEARNISLALRGREVLRDVSLSFHRGEITILVGPNGAGKSSLMHILAGLEAPKDGRVLVDEALIGKMPAVERARAVSFLPQNPEIAWDVDVAHLVGLGRLPWAGMTDAERDEEIVQSAMERADIAQFSLRKAQRLSGGEKARVHMSRMLAGEAEWLLLDEPFAALDPAHVMSASRLLLEEARRGAGIVLIVHDLTLAAHIADKIVFLKDGAVAAEGPPRDVMTARLLSDIFSTEMRVSEAADGLNIQPAWNLADI